MAVTTGTIQELNLFESFCCVKMLRTDDTISYLLLWSYGPSQEDNARNRLLHGMFFSLARDAYLNGRTVRLTHDSGSSLVTAVTVE